MSHMQKRPVATLAKRCGTPRARCSCQAGTEGEARTARRQGMWHTMRTMHRSGRDARRGPLRSKAGKMAAGICCCPWGGLGDFWGGPGEWTAADASSHRMCMQHTPGRDASALKGRLRQEHTDPKRSLKAGTHRPQKVERTCTMRTMLMHTMQVAPGNKLRAELP